MYEIKHTLHESKSSAFMEIKRILFKIGVKEISISTTENELNFHKKDLFEGSFFNLGKDKIGLLITMEDESFARDLGHEIKVAIERKFIQIENVFHQSFFRQQMVNLIPNQLKWHFSGVTIKGKNKIYTVSVHRKNLNTGVIDNFESKTATFEDLQLYLLNLSMNMKRSEPSFDVNEINLN